MPQCIAGCIRHKLVPLSQHACSGGELSSWLSDIVKQREPIAAIGGEVELIKMRKKVAGGVRRHVAEYHGTQCNSGQRFDI